MSTTTFLPPLSQSHLNHILYENNNGQSSRQAKQSASTQQDESIPHYPQQQDTFVPSPYPNANHVPSYDHQKRLYQEPMSYAPYEAQYSVPNKSTGIFSRGPMQSAAPKRSFSDIFRGTGGGIGGNIKSIVIFDLIFEVVNLLFQGLIHLLRYIF